MAKPEAGAASIDTEQTRWASTAGRGIAGRILAVSSRLDAAELRSLLRAAFLGRLQPAGWEVLETEEEPHRLAAFRRPLGGDFAATGEVGLVSSSPDRPPVLVTNVLVGVSFEPLRRLAPLLDLYEVSVLHEHVWPEVTAEEGAPDSGEDRLQVRTAEDADHVAARLAPLIIAGALPFAEQYASLETLLEEFSDGDGGQDGPHLSYAALLAAAGRVDEARRLLPRLEVSGRSPHSRRIRRAVRQLERWVESGGDTSLVPDAPPPSPFTRTKPTSFSAMWAESRSESQAQGGALREVKEQARGKSRKEARAMLREALPRHGAQRQSPIWIENQLDHLWDSREDRVQLCIKMLKGAARLGIGAARAIRDRELPETSLPDWLEPPDHALYEVPTSNRWVAAELDPDVAPWLDAAYEAAPHPFGIAMLSAWLCRPNEEAGAPDALDIYIGEQRVGKVPTEEAAAYEGVVAGATARGEHPCLEAHLVQRGTGYIMELATPAGQVADL